MPTNHGPKRGRFGWLHRSLFCSVTRVGFSYSKTASALSTDPVSGLRHGSPDVGSTFGGTRIAGEVVVFQGTHHAVLSHARSECGDTEGDVRRCWPVLVLGVGAKRSSEGSLVPLRKERAFCNRCCSRSASRAEFSAVTSAKNASALVYCLPP